MEGRSGPRADGSGPPHEPSHLTQAAARFPGIRLLSAESPLLFASVRRPEVPAVVVGPAFDRDTVAVRIINRQMPCVDDRRLTGEVSVSAGFDECQYDERG